MAHSLDLSCFHKKVPARALNQDSQTSVWEQSMPLQYFANSSVQMGRFLPTWAGKSTITLCEPTFCCRHLAGWAEDFMGEHLDTFFVFPLFTFYLKTLSLYLMPLSWWWDPSPFFYPEPSASRFQYPSAYGSQGSPALSISRYPGLEGTVRKLWEGMWPGELLKASFGCCFWN